MDQRNNKEKTRKKNHCAIVDTLLSHLNHLAIRNPNSGCQILREIHVMLSNKNILK